MIKVMIKFFRMLMIMLIGMSTVKMIAMKAIYIQSVTDDGGDLMTLMMVKTKIT